MQRLIGDRYSPQTKRSIKPSLSKSPQAAASVAIGSPSPLVIVTSSKVPAPLLWSKESRIGVSHPPRSKKDIQVAVIVVIGMGRVESVNLIVQAGFS